MNHRVTLGSLLSSPLVLFNKSMVGCPRHLQQSNDHIILLAWVQYRCVPNHPLTISPQKCPTSRLCCEPSHLCFHLETFIGSTLLPQPLVFLHHDIVSHRIELLGRPRHSWSRPWSSKSSRHSSRPSSAISSFSIWPHLPRRSLPAIHPIFHQLSFLV